MRLLIIALLLGNIFPAFSQQLTWDLTENGDGISNHPELTCLDFTVGTGVTSFTFSSTGAYAKSWSQDTLLLDDYFQAGFVSSALDTFELNTIEYSERRSNTGIHNYELRYSKDSAFTNYTSMGIVTVSDNDSERDTIIKNVDILILPKDTFYLRWYGYAAEGSTGSWRINDASLKMLLSTYVKDVEAPILENAEIIDAYTIQMSFDEALDSNSYQLSDFQIDNSFSPIFLDKSLSLQGIVKLSFEQSLPQEQKFLLRYRNIADKDGNAILEDRFVDLFYYQAQAFYVLIDELMVDPTPEVYLPNSEYIELYNTKSFPINLGNWVLKNNTRTYNLPNCEISANSYLLLVPEGKAGAFDTTLNVVEMNFGSLTNSQGKLVLESSEGLWIYQVNYTEDWHEESYKKKGGWSLEMIDRTQVCNMSNNWASSVNEKGGTPGELNSINGENTNRLDLELLNVYFDTSNVILQFNQYLSPTFKANLEAYALDDNHPQSISYWLGDDFMSLDFADIYEDNQPYILTITDTLLTCDGQYLDIPFSLRIGKPTSVDSNDIVFNELFFNPVGKNKQYIEFYNQSDKILDLQEMKLAVLDDDVLKPKHVISDVPTIIFPHDYFVLTKDRANILTQFEVKYPDRLFQTEEIPSISTTEDYLYLMNKGDKVIDMMYYKEDFHNPILSDVEGVSLEKIKPSISGVEALSWQSASEVSGFGTPTYKNSQYTDLGSDKQEYTTFENETFSPDMDGYNDYLIINYRLDKSGYVANVNIYNAKGQFVYELVSNEFMGKEGQWTWNGKNANEQSSPLGIYIIVFEFIHADGSIVQEKRVCTLAGKL